MSRSTSPITIAAVSDDLRLELEQLRDEPQFLSFDLPLEALLNVQEFLDAVLLHLVISGRGWLLPELIKLGANVNCKGEHGYSPLHEASEQGHDEIITMLISHGANKEALNDDGFRPRDCRSE